MTTKQLTPVQRRLIETAAEIATDPSSAALAFIHTVLCQTYLPYRDPGRDVGPPVATEPKVRFSARRRLRSPDRATTSVPRERPSPAV
jgi:hypothetical protein